jgi:hypothetical protein
LGGVLEGEVWRVRIRESQWEVVRNKAGENSTEQTRGLYIPIPDSHERLHVPAGS